MKLKTLAGIALAVLTIAACDDNTEEVGMTLTNNLEHLDITTDSFEVTTRSIIADSVYSRNTTGYLGKIKDPETGSYITCDFMTQFHLLEGYGFPEAERVKSRIDDEIVADSCEIRLYMSEFYGDSLATMKLTATELAKPMSEANTYYSNYDPEGNGYTRNGGLTVSKMYTLTDFTVSDSTREDDDYVRNIRIKLDQPYTDAEGNTYNNFGTYIMRTYYKHPEYFKNAYTFTNNVVPGFYIKSTGGLGSMAYIYVSQLNVYFRYDYNNNDSIVRGTASYAGTEEVLQLTHFTNDTKTISELAADNSCTYLKTPAGIFTEMTLPIDEILTGHASDSIVTAKVALQRINNSTQSEYNLGIPSSLLMIPKGEIYSFFENNQVADAKSSFIATYSTSDNSYTFNNISSLIKYLDTNRATLGDEWNRVVIIPVTTTTSSTGTLTKVVHDMSLASTKLVGGSNNAYNPTRISIVYTKFK